MLWSGATGVDADSNMLAWLVENRGRIDGKAEIGQAHSGLTCPFRLKYGLVKRE